MLLHPNIRVQTTCIDKEYKTNSIPGPIRRMPSHVPESGGNKNALTRRQSSPPKLWGSGSVAAFVETEVVGIQKMIRFGSALFRLLDGWERNEAKNGPNGGCVGMILPDRVDQHLDHDFAQRV